MVYTGGAGLQELMVAENEASAIIAEARAARIERMKSAKRDAKCMVDAFRAEKESVYQSSIEHNLGRIEVEGVSLQKQTDSDIHVINKQYQKNEQAVIDMVVKEVANVICQVPESRKHAFLHG